MNNHIKRFFLFNIKGLTIDERKRREIALAQTKKLKGEIFSLWCYELYRLSIANQVYYSIFQ